MVKFWKEVVVRVKEEELKHVFVFRVAYPLGPIALPHVHYDDESNEGHGGAVHFVSAGASLPSLLDSGSGVTVLVDINGAMGLLPL